MPNKIKVPEAVLEAFAAKKELGPAALSRMEIEALEDAIKQFCEELLGDETVEKARLTHNASDPFANPVRHDVTKALIQAAIHSVTGGGGG